MVSKLKGRVLVISGSDPSGGAGLQGDIKTITSLGGFSTNAITAITNQDTKKVYDIYDLNSLFVAKQIKTVLNDIGSDSIKIGMLSNPEIIKCVSLTLSKYAKNIPIVLDPVMSSQTGYKLIKDNYKENLLSRLIPKCLIITPNLPEAEILTGKKIRSVSDMIESIDSLRKLGAEAVLLKGGHLEGSHLTDLLITKEKYFRYDSNKIDTSSTHGTGCALSSAIATGLAQSLSLEDSVKRARKFVYEAIKLAPGYGRGSGPLNHCLNFSRLD